MRKLASIQRIEEVLPIEGADAIEKIRIQGWWCVTQKGNFKPQDLCLYFEVDSLLPNIPQFSFLSKGNTLKKSIIEDGKEVIGFRLKTIRLRGQISQGLALPLFQFPEITDREIGTEVTKQIGVYRYEPPIPVHLAGEMKGLLPGIIPKTDEERVQNCLSLLNKYKGQRFYLTSKIDGTSSTFYKSDGIFGACGHSLEFIENDKNIFWKLANRYNLKEKLPDGYAIQAETAGEGIQSNRIKLKGVDLYVFYVFDIKKQQYLKLDDMLSFVKGLGLKTVPILNDNFILNHTCDELLKMADIPSPLNPQLLQEGTVFRLYDSLEKISFKALSNEYILKWGL
jgi:RNA ligase (TIGR02306 family)